MSLPLTELKVLSNMTYRYIKHLCQNVDGLCRVLKSFSELNTASYAFFVIVWQVVDSFELALKFDPEVLVFNHTGAEYSLLWSLHAAAWLGHWTSEAFWTVLASGPGCDCEKLIKGIVCCRIVLISLKVCQTRGPGSRYNSCYKFIWPMWYYIWLFSLSKMLAYLDQTKWSFLFIVSKKSSYEHDKIARNVPTIKIHPKQ